MCQKIGTIWVAHLFPLKMSFAKPWKHMQRRPDDQSLDRRFALPDFTKDLTLGAPARLPSFSRLPP